MSSKLLYFKQNYGIGFYLISLIVLYYTYNYQLEFKPCCDAVSYQGIANHYIQNGLFAHHDLANLRLYGFPFLLSFFYIIFGVDYGNLFYAVFISFGYLFLAILIVGKLKKYVKNFNILHIAFAMNIFLFPYLTIPLADGISVLFWMIIFYTILQIISNTNKNIIFLLFFFSSFLIGMSIMLRPSNINLVILLPLLYIVSYMIKQNINKIIVALLVISGFAVAIYPQMYINFIYFEKLTFLPTVELGNLQIKWGIEYIKYGTNLSGEGIPQLYYKNPFYSPVENLGLNWYFENLGDGIKTIFLHLFNVFTYDYYFPYIYDLYPKHKLVILFYSWFILFYGMIGVSELLNKIKNNKQYDDRLVKFLLYIILPLVFVSTLSILSTSAVEVRFSLPLVLILLPFAYWSFFNNLKNFKLWAVFTLWISCASLISSFVDLQKNIPYM